MRGWGVGPALIKLHYSNFSNLSSLDVEELGLPWVAPPPPPPQKKKKKNKKKKMALGLWPSKAETLKPGSRETPTLNSFGKRTQKPRPTDRDMRVMRGKGSHTLQAEFFRLLECGLVVYPCKVSNLDENLEHLPMRHSLLQLRIA